MVDFRAARVTLRGPDRTGRKLPDLEVNVVLVSERDPPPGVEPIEWILLTDLPIETVEDVLKIIDYYMCRWQIEIYFRILKSGCKVEESQLETAARFEPYLALCHDRGLAGHARDDVGPGMSRVALRRGLRRRRVAGGVRHRQEATAAGRAALDEDHRRSDCVVGRLAGSALRWRTGPESHVGRHATHDGPCSGLACPCGPQRGRAGRPPRLEAASRVKDRECAGAHEGRRGIVPGRNAARDREAGAQPRRRWSGPAGIPREGIALAIVVRR